MIRTAYSVLLAVTLAGCGGGPAAPSTVTQFPDIIGTWSGTRTVDVRGEDGSTSSGVCTDVWTITWQSEGEFAGAFQTGSGVSSCSEQSGSLTGTITSSGAIISFVIRLSQGQNPCLSVARSAYNGGFSDRTLSIRYSEELVCVVPPGVARSASRTIAMAFTRQ